MIGHTDLFFHQFWDATHQIAFITASWSALIRIANDEEIYLWEDLVIRWGTEFIFALLTTLIGGGFSKIILSPIGVSGLTSSMIVGALVGVIGTFLYALYSNILWGNEFPSWDKLSINMLLSGVIGGVFGMFGHAFANSIKGDLMDEDMAAAAVGYIGSPIGDVISTIIDDLWSAAENWRQLVKRRYFVPEQ